MLINFVLLLLLLLLLLIIIIVSSFHISLCTDLTYFISLLQEHRASMKHLQHILFWAKAPTSFQMFPTFQISSSTVHLQVLLEVFLSYVIPKGSN
jgi:hypothetical protein